MRKGTGASERPEQVRQSGRPNEVSASAQGATLSWVLRLKADVHDPELWCLCTLGLLLILNS